MIKSSMAVDLEGRKNGLDLLESLGRPERAPPYGTIPALFVARTQPLTNPAA